MIIGIANIIGCKPTSGPSAVVPSNINPPSLTGSGIIGTTVSCSDGIWIGTPPITFTYQWQRDGVDITGETASVYLLVIADFAAKITCKVTATNVVGSVPADSDYIVGIGVAPSNTVAPVISGTNTVGSVLSTTNGTWTGTSPITYTYQWQRDGSNISGATSSTYTTVQADASYKIICIVTATNIAGFSTAISNDITVFDVNAQAVINAIQGTGVTLTTTEKNACNSLISSLKSYSLWTKIDVLYGFLGGTAAAHKFNWVNPLDTDAARRLVFNGGWTHSATGILGNGVNSYADSKFPMNGFSQNDSHLSIYCRTNTTANIIDYGVQFTSVSYSSFISCKLSGNFNSRLNTSGFSDGLTANTDSKGHYLSYRNNSANITTRKNLNTANTFSQTSTTAGANTLPVFLGNLNFNGTPLGGYYSNREYCFATIGKAFTASESTIFYNIVQAYQTTLGRQV